MTSAEDTADGTRSAFHAAAGWLLELLGGIGESEWERRATDAWTVRALTAHTVRAFTTVETYLAEPTTIEILAAGRYFEVALSNPAVHAAVAERGRDGAAALGDDPLATTGEIVERVLALVDRTAGDAPCATRAGGMHLDEYLRTRVVELTLHGLDLARAVGQAEEPPPVALAVTAAVLAEAAVFRGRGVEVIAALSGRGRLPDGFNSLG